MVGEIRDSETAEIAIQAALTGHLVFSTLHTNDSFGALTRLVDMGIEPFLVSSSVMAVLAQRLRARGVSRLPRTVRADRSGTDAHRARRRALDQADLSARRMQGLPQYGLSRPYRGARN